MFWVEPKFGLLIFYFHGFTKCQDGVEDQEGIFRFPQIV